MFSVAFSVLARWRGWRVRPFGGDEDGADVGLGEVADDFEVVEFLVDGFVLVDGNDEEEFVVVATEYRHSTGPTHYFR